MPDGGEQLKRIVENVGQDGGTLWHEGEDVQAYIGPVSRVNAFEVGDEVYEAFEAAGFDAWLCIAPEMKSGTSTFGKPTGYSCCLKGKEGE